MAGGVARRDPLRSGTRRALVLARRQPPGKTERVFRGGKSIFTMGKPMGEAAAFRRELACRPLELLPFPVGRP